MSSAHASRALAEFVLVGLSHAMNFFDVAAKVADEIKV
jgi:hypothetical protein